jgi:hypothetical protein
VENGVLRAAGSESYLVSDNSFGSKLRCGSIRGGEWGVLFRTDAVELKNKRPRGMGAAFTFKDSTNDVDGHMRMEVQPTKDGNPGVRIIVNVKPNDWFPVELTFRQDQIDVQISGGSVSDGVVSVEIVIQNESSQAGTVWIKELFVRSRN